MTTLAPSLAFDGRGAVTVAALMAAYMEAVNISLPKRGSALHPGHAIDGER
ncbi:hypothetical protein [Bradyrhizobium sp. JR3.5]